MSQKWTSVVTQILLAICGSYFLYISYNFNDGGTSVYASAGYYPMIISGMIVFFSITGILSDLIGKGKDNEKKIDLTNIKNVGLVALAVAIIICVWQLLDLFYVGAFIGTGMLLVGLDPAEKTKKTVAKSLLIALVMVVITFVVFEFALKIHV